MTEYRIVIVGGEGVGKSNLKIRFNQNIFIEEYERTIDERYQRQVTIDEEVSLFDIIDAEEEGYKINEIKELQVGYICAYSITSRESFEEISKIREKILRIKREVKIPMVIVANKCELENERKVTSAEGEKLAKSFGCPFFETSSKEKINVDESFFELVREIRKYNREMNGVTNNVIGKGNRKGKGKGKGNGKGNGMNASCALCPRAFR